MAKARQREFYDFWELSDILIRPLFFSYLSKAFSSFCKLCISQLSSIRKSQTNLQNAIRPSIIIDSPIFQKDRFDSLYQFYQFDYKTEMSQKWKLNHESCIKSLKQLKKYNDQLNSLIGVEPLGKILKKVNAETHISQSIIYQIEGFITQMEQQYVDPLTSRKMSSLKQHFRIQKDRRINMDKQVKSLVEKQRNQRYLLNLQRNTHSTLVIDQDNEWEHTKEEQVKRNAQPIYILGSSSITSSMMPQQNQLQEILVYHNDAKTNKTSKKEKIISFMQSNKKKIGYFMLFTAVKIAAFMIFFY